MTRRRLTALPGLLLLASAAPLLAPSAARAQENGESPFAVAGVEDPREVERFLSGLKRAVADDDRARVADMVNFPLRTNLRGRAARVRGRREFLRNYRSIFTAKVKRALAEEETGGLFANWRGVMVGDGEIWFRPSGRDGRLKIVTVNN